MKTEDDEVDLGRNEGDHNESSWKMVKQKWSGMKGRGI